MRLEFPDGNGEVEKKESGRSFSLCGKFDGFVTVSSAFNPSNNKKKSPINEMNVSLY